MGVVVDAVVVVNVVVGAVGVEDLPSVISTGRQKTTHTGNNILQTTDTGR